LTQKIQIPQRLIDAEFRFIKVENRGKKPIERDWPSKKNYEGSNQEILNHIEKGGNYGVIGDKERIIIDCDTQELKDIAEKNLPRTFTVRTPGHDGKHYYYFCKVDAAIRLRDKNKENVGDIQGIGKQVVGASCTHPNGKVYQ